ncbi:helix-turn-helix transcriptional regulator [Chloroflexota bacterium]
MEEKATMTVLEASKKLSISRALAYQLAREGKLPGAIRLGSKRIIVSRVQFERWLNGSDQTKEN